MKGIRELLLKIRHKLIHLLGGYTEQKVMPANRCYIQKELFPIRLVAEVCFSTELSDVAEYRERMMEKVAFQVAEEMLNKSLIRFLETQETFLDRYVLRGDVMVLDPHQWVMLDRRQSE